MLIVFAFLKCTHGGMWGFNPCLCLYFATTRLCLSLFLEHASHPWFRFLIWNLYCYQSHKQNDIDMTWIFEVILRAVFFLSDFQVLVVCQHFSALFNACGMHDLVGTRLENCFLMIIVVSMGNRYDSQLKLSRLTMKISSFLSFIFFHS